MERYRWHDAHSWVKKTAEDAGFEVIDPLSQWQGRYDPAELRVHGDALHYSAAGNDLLAHTIADAVIAP